MNAALKDSQMPVAAVPAIDFVELLKDIPRGAWVTISVDNGPPRVAAFGSDIQKVMNDARQKGDPEPLVMRVPETNTSLML